MAFREDLHLHEQLVLLALRDDTGKRESNQWTDIGLAAGLLAELSFAERIGLEHRTRRRQPLVTLVGPRRLGDPLLDDVVGRIASARRRASLSTWTSRVASTRKLLQRTAEPLVRRGILAHQRVPFLIFFERSRFPTRDPGPEGRLLEDIRGAVASPVEEVPPRMRVLLGIAHATGMLRPVFDRKERKGLEKHLRALRKDEPFAAAAEAAVSAAVAAAAAG